MVSSAGWGYSTAGAEEVVWGAAYNVGPENAMSVNERMMMDLGKGGCYGGRSIMIMRLFERLLEVDEEDETHESN